MLRVSIESNLWTDYVLPTAGAVLTSVLALLTYLYVRLTRRLADEALQGRLSAQTPQVTVIVAALAGKASFSNLEEIRSPKRVGESDLGRLHVVLECGLKVTNHGPGPSTCEIRSGTPFSWVVAVDAADRAVASVEVLAEGEVIHFLGRWSGSGDQMRTMLRDRGRGADLVLLTGNRVTRVEDTHKVHIEVDIDESAEGLDIHVPIATCADTVASTDRKIPGVGKPAWGRSTAGAN